MKRINIEGLKALIEKYRKGQVQIGDHVICVEFSYGGEGSILDRRVTEVTEGEVSYRERSYDYVDVKTDTTHVMYWTDNIFDEPYNQNGHLYIPYSFSKLGPPAKEKDGIYFYDKLLGGADSTFAVYGFMVNEFWRTINFGLVVGPDDVEFVKGQIVKLLGAFQ